jgi:ubiquinone/menaquinone biosynthesis C-methylase UbiE
VVRGIEQNPWAYDLLMEIVERLGLKAWRENLVAGARGRVLDLGCGTGRNLALFRGEATVIGLELDLWLLQRARRRGPQVPMVVGRAEALPFRDASFDTVVSSLVFCSVADPAAGMQEVGRVLRAGGRVRMFEHVRSSNRLVGWAQDGVQPLWTAIAGGCHPNRDTEATVQEAGFLIERHEIPGRTTLRCFSAHLPERDPGFE